MDNEKRFLSKIGKKYQNAVLENCDQKIISPDLIKWGFEWAKNPTSIFIFGEIGCGKTFYACSLIRQALRVEKRYYYPDYFVATSLDSEGLEAIKSENGDRKFLDKIKSSDLLFIDDFGREIKSERLSAQYFDIINYRYADERPTIITSNLDTYEIGYKIGEEIASRFLEWEIIHLNGENYRNRNIRFLS